MQLVDVHAHLCAPEFAKDLPAVLDTAAAAGVTRILAVGETLEDARRNLELADRFPMVRPCAGLYPTVLDEAAAEGMLAFIRQHRDRLVAIGEVGLDYHYNWSPPETQRDVFRRQIRVARSLGLPLIIHQREAEKDLIEILDQEKASEVGGILHSFTAGRETALAAIERGFLISFSGILTFKNAESLREVARELPPDKILLETDCPYLAPVPHRGKRNEPAFVRETAATLAGLKGTTVREVEEATDENFRRFFGL